MINLVWIIRRATKECHKAQKLVYSNFVNSLRWKQHISKAVQHISTIYIVVFFEMGKEDVFLSSLQELTEKSIYYKYVQPF